MEELAFTPVHELIHLIHTRQLSPREVVEAFLERITRLNPDLKAYLTVAEDEARRAAAEAEATVARTDRLPLLSGIPVAVKDLEFTKGLRTTGGSLAYQGFVPREDSVVVERLRRAGAIILGKTNTPEFGSYGQTWNRLSEDCRTPWDRSRTSGGSSGGSAAAVAAGLAPFATGTDGAGSIRAPAAFCGVYGFKPSFGRIPMYGGFLGLPLHTCPGPLARSVRDAAIMLSVLCGHDPRDPNSTRQTPPDFVGEIEGADAGSSRCLEPRSRICSRRRRSPEPGRVGGTEPRSPGMSRGSGEPARRRRPVRDCRPGAERGQVRRLGTPAQDLPGRSDPLRPFGAGTRQPGHRRRDTPTRFASWNASTPA